VGTGSVRPVPGGTGPVPIPKPYLKYWNPSESAGITGKPGRVFPHGNRPVHGRVNPDPIQRRACNNKNSDVALRSGLAAAAADLELRSDELCQAKPHVSDQLS
jgi:hypothetical protein